MPELGAEKLLQPSTAGRALFIRCGGGGGCVLQFLPCQPSILERMKQPWRIRAVQLTSRAGLRIPAGVGFSAPA